MFAGVALLLSAVGCGAPRGGYATNSSVCAPALPAARATVRDHGTLVLVRPVGRPELDELFPGRLPPRAPSTPSPARPPTATGPAPTPGPGAPQPRACLVVYRGPYAAGSLPTSPTGGTYAIIGVAVRTATVIGVTTSNTRPSQHAPTKLTTPAPSAR